jgi:DNA polymerase-3 subunit beta
MVSVATDSKKLVKMENFLVTHPADKQDGHFTLPTKPCNILLSLLAKCEGDISYAFDERNAIFKNDAFCMVTRLVEGNYPKYNAVIPTQSTKFATIDKEEFLLALKPVMPMGNTQTQLVLLKFATVITSGVDIIAQDIEFNKSAQEHIDCEYNGDDIAIGFNGMALMQLVQNVSCDKFILAMDTPKRAGVITEVNENNAQKYTSIIMPICINNA